MGYTEIEIVGRLGLHLILFCSQTFSRHAFRAPRILKQLVLHTPLGAETLSLFTFGVFLGGTNPLFFPLSPWFILVVSSLGSE